MKCNVTSWSGAVARHPTLSPSPTLLILAKCPPRLSPMTLARYPSSAASSPWRLQRVNPPSWNQLTNMTARGPELTPFLDGPNHLRDCQRWTTTDPGTTRVYLHGELIFLYPGEIHLETRQDPAKTPAIMSPLSAMQQAATILRKPSSVPLQAMTTWPAV